MERQGRPDGKYVIPTAPQDTAAAQPLPTGAGRGGRPRAARSSGSSEKAVRPDLLVKCPTFLYGFFSKLQLLHL